MLILISFTTIQSTWAQKVRLSTPKVDSVIVIETPECPHCLKIVWDSIPNADYYEILKYDPNNNNNLPEPYPEGDPYIYEPFFIDRTSNASLYAEKYHVVARSKSSQNFIDSPWSDTVITLYLNPIEYDSCNTSINLSWTGKNNNSRFKIYRNTNNSDFILIDSTNATKYTDNKLEANSTYSYKITLTDNNTFSNSNTREKQITSLLIPNPNKQFIYKIHPSANGFAIYANTDSSIQVSSYTLYASSNINGNYTQVSTLPYTGSENIIFNNATTSWYKFLTKNICGVYVDTSNTIRPVTLTAIQNGNNVALEWNSAFHNPEYEEFYLIIISDNQIILEEKIENSENKTNIDISTLGGSTNESYVFQIKNINEKSYQVLSNYAQVYKTVFLNIPNAFTPNSDHLNDRIGPFQKYITNTDVTKFSSFHFRVIDKYGGVVYKTNNPDNSWDGTKQGIQLHEGPYFYNLDFTTGEGQKIEQTGFIELIYP